MSAAHFNVIRVGESVWSTWEPRNGEFDLEWLQPVLDGAHARGIGVILGTPSYAVPPWLWRTYPEIAGEVATGRPQAPVCTAAPATGSRRLRRCGRRSRSARHGHRHGGRRDQ